MDPTRHEVPADRGGSGRLRIIGWVWIGVGVFYALFAFTEAGGTALALLELVDQPTRRAAPPLFVLHAFTGGIALLAVSLQLQLAGPLPLRRRRLHRRLGRIYVVTASATSLLSLWVVARFDVNALTKAGFFAEAVLWLLTTMIAYVLIRRGRIAAHREWMIRSFALAAFFITFSLWDPLMELTPLPPVDAYALAVFLGWALNLVGAEVWIRRTGRMPSPPRVTAERPLPRP